ncbi:unnamed protein product, partial [Iphiclides podalirius]
MCVHAQGQRSVYLASLAASHSGRFAPSRSCLGRRRTKIACAASLALRVCCRLTSACCLTCNVVGVT